MPTTDITEKSVYLILNSVVPESTELVLETLRGKKSVAPESTQLLVEFPKLLLLVHLPSAILTTLFGHV